MNLFSFSIFFKLLVKSIVYFKLSKIKIVGTQKNKNKIFFINLSL